VSLREPTIVTIKRTFFFLGHFGSWLSPKGFLMSADSSPSQGVLEEALALHQRGTVDLGLWQFIAQQGNSVLELGCGSGRVLIPLVELGLDAVGLELDPVLSAAGVERLNTLPDGGLGVRLVLGDMRAFDLGRQFDWVIVPYNTYCLVSDAELKASLACVASHLRPDGRVFVEAQLWPNPESCDFPWEQATGPVSVPVRQQPFQFSERATQLRAKAPLKVERRFVGSGGAATVYTLNMQIRTMEQWDGLLAEAGFERVGPAHDALGKPMCPESRCAFFQATPLGRTSTATAE
jgi:SAM-dependent methyltransferase